MSPKRLMRKKITPWFIALLCAISIHILILETSESLNWFDTPSSQPARFSLFLLQSTTTHQNVARSSNQEDKQNMIFNGLINPLLSADDFLKESLLIGTLKINALDTSDIDLENTKPNLLDLSNISLPSAENDREFTNIFSKELRDKITESQKIQKEYLKGQIKEVEYPITEGADGTRYVNIKGVCWRIPNQGSDEPWAIVASGCNGQTKSFNFELNISPSVFLGEDSPFSSGQ